MRAAGFTRAMCRVVIANRFEKLTRAAIAEKKTNTRTSEAGIGGDWMNLRHGHDLRRSSRHVSVPFSTATGYEKDFNLVVRTSKGVTGLPQSSSRTPRPATLCISTEPAEVISSHHVGVTFSVKKDNLRCGYSHLISHWRPPPSRWRFSRSDSNLPKRARADEEKDPKQPSKPTDPAGSASGAKAFLKSKGY